MTKNRGPRTTTPPGTGQGTPFGNRGTGTRRGRAMDAPWTRELLSRLYAAARSFLLFFATYSEAAAAPASQAEVRSEGANVTFKTA